MDENLYSYLMSPPAAFAVVLGAMFLFTWAMKALSLKGKAQPPGATKPYACGEESNPMVQPDYRQFFPFAFFFTVLHVTALLVTTLPPQLSAVSFGGLVIGFVYILGAVVGLLVLYRK